MARDHDIDLSKTKFTSRLIIERALARGWGVQGFETNAAIYLLHIPSREQPIKIFSASPPQMSYPAAKIAKDKRITHEILEIQNLPMPGEVLVNGNDIKTDPERLEDFIQLYGSVVIKPLDTSHGKGITVNIKTLKDLQKALDTAFKETSKAQVLMQQQVEGYDIRILCIDFQFIDAITRTPASVVGDGKHSIAELIDITNQSPDRGENYQARLNFIPKDKVRTFLVGQGINDIPTVGERVQVIGVSNIGMGGERKNVKNDIPQFIKTMAELAAKTLELPVCGVDFLLSTLPKQDSTLEQLKPVIIEVNECPMLTMYEDLGSVEQTKIIDAYLDYLAQ